MGPKAKSRSPCRTCCSRGSNTCTKPCQCQRRRKRRLPGGDVLHRKPGLEQDTPGMYICSITRPLLRAHRNVILYMVHQLVPKQRESIALQRKSHDRYNCTLSTKDSVDKPGRYIRIPFLPPRSQSRSPPQKCQPLSISRQGFPRQPAEVCCRQTERGLSVTATYQVPHAPT